MAENVEPQLVAPVATPVPRIAAPRKKRAYRARFLIAYAVLAALAAAAIAASLALVWAGAPPQEETWSSWRPVGDDESTYPAQIAEHVGLRYRLPSGNQLVGVLSGPPIVPVSPETSIAVTHVAIPQASGDIEVHAVGEDGAIYRLCGLGENCAIGEGEPSEERARLLRRQALELALYTFKYVDDAATVIVQLPPPPQSDQQSGALLFRREDFTRPLDVPLARTLERPDPPAVIVRMTPVEGIKVDRLTQPRLFRFAYQATPDQTGLVLLLTRPNDG